MQPLIFAIKGCKPKRNRLEVGESGLAGISLIAAFTSLDAVIVKDGRGRGHRISIFPAVRHNSRVSGPSSNSIAFAMKLLPSLAHVLHPPTRTVIPSNAELQLSTPRHREKFSYSLWRRQSGSREKK